MSNPIVIIDSNYLCRRAQYTTGGMQYNGIRTGVIYGFLKEIANLRERFGPKNFVFCFDSQKSKRKDYCPLYKKNRDDRIKNLSKYEFEEESHFRTQIILLQNELLEELGFANVIAESGYEADDLIASAAKSALPKNSVIVSSDHDLYQLLSDNVVIWHPAKKQLMTADSFQKEYGISPSKWHRVKSIAGCATDCVAGVLGVGEVTAIKYLTGQLGEYSSAWGKINRATDRIRHNHILVKLPFPGTPEIEIKNDKISKIAWSRMVKKYGMTSLSGML